MVRRAEGGCLEYNLQVVADGKGQAKACTLTCNSDADSYCYLEISGGR